MPIVIDKVAYDPFQGLFLGIDQGGQPIWSKDPKRELTGSELVPTFEDQADLDEFLGEHQKQNWPENAYLQEVHPTGAPDSTGRRQAKANDVANAGLPRWGKGIGVGR